jgi:hypothetical protein
VPVPIFLWFLHNINYKKDDISNRRFLLVDTMKGGPGGVGGTSSGFNSPASSNSGTSLHNHSNSGTSLHNHSNSGTSLHNHSSSTTAEGWQVTGIHTSILGMALP